MATTAFTMNSETSVSRRIIVGSIALLGIFLLSALLFTINYWGGIVFLFVSLLIFIRFMFKEHQARNLWLLLILSLFVAVLVGSLVQSFLLTNLQDHQLVSAGDIFLTSVLIGLGAALAGVIIPFLLLVAIATVGILKWHKNVSFWAAYGYLLTSVLGIFHFSVTIDSDNIEEIKGKEKDIERLKIFGGPGWLNIYPGQVVVLHHGGKITRAVGMGSTMLKRKEQIKSIIPLTGKGNPNTIDNVLTRDRIPLTITVFHTVQMEPAAETKKRLEQAVTDAETQLQTIKDDQDSSKEDRKAAEQCLEEAKQKLQALENDKIIGDDHDECYESIAKLVARKAPDVWGSMKGGVTGNIKDVIMSCDFEDLFSINGHSQDLESSINNRKIAEIETFVREKAGGSGPGKGVILKNVDISEIHFPEEIKEKINKEITALVDARIKKTEAETNKSTAQLEADAREIKAQSEETVARFKASERVQLARAEAQGESLKAKAKVEHYKQVIQMLKGEKLSDDTIKTVLQNLASSASLEDELKQLLQLTIHYIRGEHTVKTLSEPVSDRDKNF